MNTIKLLFLALLLPLFAACDQAPAPVEQAPVAAPVVTAPVVAEVAAAVAEPVPAAAERGITSRAVSGIAVSDLPPEGRETLDLIKKGGPYPYSKDGSTFGNRERLLPEQAKGYYREYTVPTPGSPDRGARRIISGGTGGEYWYTADHYRSFEQIRE